LAQLDHDTGVEFGRVRYQRALGCCGVGGRHGGRQHVDGVADGADVILAECARLDRARQFRQLRGQRGAGQ
jgi:hypothetical protein